MILKDYDADHKAMVKWVKEFPGWQKKFAWFPKHVTNMQGNTVEIWLQSYWRQPTLDHRGHKWYWILKSYNPEELDYNVR